MASKKTSSKKSTATKKASPGKPTAVNATAGSAAKTSAKTSTAKTSAKTIAAKAEKPRASEPATEKTISKTGPTAKKSTTGPSEESGRSTTKSQAANEIAQRVLAGEDEKSIADLGDDLISGKTSVASQAGRVLDEIVNLKPEAVVSIIDRYAKAVGGPLKRPAQSAAHALPVMARVAPARVARHLPKLKDCFDTATEPGKDGLVRTFAGLCTASVAYQKRLEDVLNKALREADAKTLIAWTEVVLPALKGEPHARARATVEARLDRIPRVHAQRIADFLGIKLRLRYR